MQAAFYLVFSRNIWSFPSKATPHNERRRPTCQPIAAAEWFNLAMIAESALTYTARQSLSTRMRFANANMIIIPPFQRQIPFLQQLHYLSKQFFLQSIGGGRLRDCPCVSPSGT